MEKLKQLRKETIEAVIDPGFLEWINTGKIDPARNYRVFLEINQFFDHLEELEAIKIKTENE